MNQEQPKLNMSIEELEQALAEKKGETKAEQTEQTPDTQKEMVKEVLEEHIEQQQAVSSPPSAQTQQQIQQQAEEVQASPEKQERFQKIVNIAFEDNIYHAVKVARATNDSYLVDALHDFLTDHYSDLLERNKIKRL